MSKHYMLKQINKIKLLNNVKEVKMSKIRGVIIPI